MQQASTQPQPAQVHARPRISSAAWLWCSAIILTALIIVQAGRIAPSLLPEARADLVAGVAGYTTLTLNSQSEDILLVLDGRGEQVFLYRILNQRQLELIGRQDLNQLFAAGARIGAGRK